MQQHLQQVGFKAVMSSHFSVERRMRSRAAEEGIRAQPLAPVSAVLVCTSEA